MPTLQGWAKIGITIQFLALVRTLAEYFRLEHMHGAAVSATLLNHYVAGGLGAALLTWLAVGCYFFGRFRFACAVSGLTIAGMLAFKIVVIGT